MKKLYSFFLPIMTMVLLVPTLGHSQAKIVISQVYGGGGNSGATLKNDFIELFNAGDQAQNLSGWSVQYTSTSGTTWTNSTTLSGTIQPGKYYLIQQGTGGGGTVDLPAPDATGSIAMAGSNGKVALVNSTTALSGSCPTGANVIDFVGYGTANCFEGSGATGALSNTTAAIRKNNGCTDTDNNNNDFDVATANPRNSSSAAFSCSGPPTPTPPSGTGLSTPATVEAGASVLLTVTVTPGTNPTSTGLQVAADLTGIGGAANQGFFDNGTNGDVTAGDNIFSYTATVAANTTAGIKTINYSITDVESRNASGDISLTIQVPAPPIQPSLVISQVYGGGGNSGAPFNSDFVEIFNQGNAPISLSGLSIQYASATGTGNFGASATQLVALNGILQPGKYYLIRLAGGSTGAALPTPDATGTINMSGSAGKVVLAEGTSGLGCNGGSTPCSPAQLARIIDLVGFGSANFFEGSSAAPLLTNSTAAFRLIDGCQDTDNNSADFVTGTPAPRNSASPANFCASKIVISQIYGGGGNSGATLKNDFIELFNAGNIAQDLTGWSVQYASATGNFNQATTLSGTILPGKYYLVQLAQGTNTALPALPAPDANGTMNLSGTTGKVALVNNSTLLGICDLSASSLVDLVGFGTSATCFEGTGPTSPNLSNSTAAFRLQGGCVDTDDNRADFVNGTPAPRNSASPANICVIGFGILTNTLPDATAQQPYNTSIVSTGGTEPVTFSITPGALPNGLSLAPDGTLSGTPTTSVGSPFNFTVTATDANQLTASKAFSLVVNPAPVCNPTFTIAEVQGSGLTSPLLTNNVTISGIVTGLKSNGFFMQMPEGDGNPATSDGIFIFTSSTPPLAVQLGNNVCVTGTVFEFTPSADFGGRSLTQLTTPTSIFNISSNNPLPSPVVLTGSILTPDGGVDQLEQYEAMRVTVTNLTVVAPTQSFTTEQTATAASNGFFYGVIAGTDRPFREPGIQTPITAPVSAPPTVARWDGNPELIGIASSVQPGTTPIDVSAGATVENVTGPLDFVRRYYVINLDGQNTPAVSNNNLAASPAPLADEDELTVATYNLERFFDNVDAPGIGDPVLTATAYQNRLNKASLGIRNILNMPDVIGFQEIENISVLQALADRVNADAVAAGLPNPAYVAYLEEGNDPGGIDVGFMVKSTRVQVQSVTQFGKDVTFTNPTTGNQDLTNDRPPLVLQATFLNPTECQPPVPFIVISNHLRSLNGNDDLTDGRVRSKRLAQAEYLANLIQGFQAANPDVKLISLGDYNDFEFNDGYVDIVGTVKGTPVDASEVVLASPVITNPALVNLIDGIEAGNRYSYNFSGSAQVLDHILVNAVLNNSVTRVVPVHMNADFAGIIRSDFNRPERVTDHDPVIAYFRFAPPPPPVCSIEAIPASDIYTGGVVTNIYLGYGPQSVTLQASAINGNSFTYAWDGGSLLSCNECAAPVFAPTAPGVYTFTATVTNDIGCTSTCTITICVADVRVPGTDGKKIYVCHTPAGNAANSKTLEVSINAVASQLAKPGQSSLGICGSNPCTPAMITRTPSSNKNINADVEEKGLHVQVAPNPSRDAFTLMINSSNPETVSMRITDISGKVLTTLQHIQPNTSVRTGENLSSGIYLAEIIQNRQRVVIKLMKTK
jgi:uncharacterized protein